MEVGNNKDDHKVYRFRFYYLKGIWFVDAFCSNPYKLNNLVNRFAYSMKSMVPVSEKMVAVMHICFGFHTNNEEDVCMIGEILWSHASAPLLHLNVLI